MRRFGRKSTPRPAAAARPPARSTPQASDQLPTRARPAATSGAQPVLHPTEKRRLIWFAGLLGGVVFLLGSAAFALFFAFNPDTGTNQAVQARTGGDFIQAVAADVTTFNPLFATGETAQTVMDLLFPRLLGQDPTTGLVTPTELAQGWEISGDGRTYTFFLRDSVTWSDGAPVTAADFLYTYRALGRPELASPFQSRAGVIESMQAPDAYTLIVTLTAPNCSALHSLRHPLLPSHGYAPDGSDLTANALNQTPTVSAGPFRFESHTPGASIVLARSADYWKGAPRLDRYILRIEPAAAEQARLLAAGEVNLMRWPANDVQASPGDLAAIEERRLKLHPQPGYLFLAANLADPAQPQAGRNADDARQAQSPHPVLGDPDVRRALALAIDTQGLIQSVGGAPTGEARAYALGGYLLPTISWANPAPPVPMSHDPNLARQLLDAAGWTADEAGIRRRAGAPLALRLMTNEDNPRRVAMAQAIAADLAAVGIQIRFEPLPFEDMTAELLEQRFDLGLAGWDNLAPDPGLQPFWHSRDDIPGRGFNFVSFHDPEVDLWLDQALTLPGCGPAARGALYAQVQQRVQAELPYLALIGELGGWAVAEGWHNITPGPWQLHYNVQDWGKID